MTKHNEPEDIALFRRAVQDVTPLAQDKIPPHRKALRPRPMQRHLDEQKVLRDMLSDAFDPADLETGEELFYLRPGMQHSVLHKLRRGRYSVRGELDLHGFTVREARIAINEFLRRVRVQGGGCVRIIHGKGKRSRGQQPVLKKKLNHWLRQHEETLAFCSARSVDGGTGALYVLLKKM